MNGDLEKLVKKCLSNHQQVNLECEFAQEKLAKEIVKELTSSYLIFPNKMP